MRLFDLHHYFAKPAQSWKFSGGDQKQGISTKRLLGLLNRRNYRALGGGVHFSLTDDNKARHDRGMTETDAQEMLIAHLREILPRYGRRVFSVPNERKHTGSKGARVAQWRSLKRRGASAGCPDLIVPGTLPNMPHCGGLVIEMKRNAKSSWQPGQLAWLTHYAAIGWIAARCDGLAEAMELVEAVGYV